MHLESPRPPEPLPPEQVFLSDEEPSVPVRFRPPGPGVWESIGWLAGAGVLFGVTDWIRFVVSVHGGLGILVGWAVFLLFCAAKGFYFGVFTMLAGPVIRQPDKTVLEVQIGPAQAGQFADPKARAC